MVEVYKTTIRVMSDTRNKFNHVLKKRDANGRKLWHSADDLIFALLNESNLLNDEVSK